MNTRALLLALPAVLLGSCRDNRVSVDIQAICFPPGGCTFNSTCDKVLMNAPTYDFAAGANAMLFLQVGNQLPDTTDKGTGRVNSNDAHLDQAAIEYEGAPLGRDVFNLGNQRVPAGGNTVIALDVIRAWNVPALGAAFNAGTGSVVAKIKLRGYYDDGARFETGEFPTSIDLCAGCEGRCPAAAPAHCPPAMEPQTCYSTTSSG